MHRGRGRAAAGASGVSRAAYREGALPAFPAKPAAAKTHGIRLAFDFESAIFTFFSRARRGVTFATGTKRSYAASSGFLVLLISTTRLAGGSVRRSDRSRETMARSIRFRSEMFVVLGFAIVLISITELGAVVAVRALRRSGRSIERMVSSMCSSSERSSEMIRVTSIWLTFLPPGRR